VTSIRLGGQPVPLLDAARIYACGITPYDVTHLGHAATFVWVDVLGRVLAHLGREPLLCRNVTDVDDVLTAAATRAGEHYDVYASVAQFRFDRDMAALQVRPPRFEPRAHAHIAGVIALAEGLLEMGAAYQVGGSVFFRGAEVPAAAGVDPERAAALMREFGEDTGDGREHAFDVAVWRAAGAEGPSFESPWGAGLPGWHAECTAMSISVLGPALDVHCGGADLAFPHHAYQAAMAEAVTGVRPYARSAFRVGTVRVAGAKMAKSTGNLVLVSDLLARHPAAALRLLLLDRPWAQPWDFQETGLEAAARKLDALYAAAGRTGQDASDEALERLRSDLDVPGALEVALREGGTAARLVIALLGLGE
jgi:cysteinyl-tRNA synthetase